MAVDQTIVNWLLGIFAVLIGILIRSMWQTLNDLRVADNKIHEKISHIEVMVADSYLKQDDFNRFSGAVFKKLDRIEDKLDSKVDKTNRQQRHDHRRGQ